MKNGYKALLFATAVALAPTAWTQGNYFTVDVVHQWLCRVNVNTGVVTYVGAANNWGEQYNGYNSTTSTCLGYHQGRLCAVTSWKVGWPRKIAFVEPYGPNAGKQVGSYYVNLPYLFSNYRISGIDSSGSDILMTWSDQNDFGALRISSIYNLANWGWVGSDDTDGYMYADGKSWAIDLGSTYYSLYSDPLAPLSYQGGDVMGANGTNPVDLANYSSSEIVAMSDSGHSIVHVSKLGGFRISVVPMTGDWQGSSFRGLAFAPPPIWNPNNQIQ